MRDDATSYAVVLISGGIRSSAHDWAGLVVAVDAYAGVTVKPLDVERSGGDASALLRIAHDYDMVTVNGSAIMERLTFMPDGVGRVDGEMRDAANAPPMLTERYRVRLNAAEIAMLGGDSPERMRGAEVDAVNTVSMSADECSLFASRQAPTPASGDLSNLDYSQSDESQTAFSSQDESHLRQAFDDVARLNALVEVGNRANFLDFGKRVDDVSSQVGKHAIDEPPSDEAANANANANANASPTEWKGSIAFLREQLRRQSGVCLIIPRADVERLLHDLERTK